jgi:hypothetical protein
MATVAEILKSWRTLQQKWVCGLLQNGLQLVLSEMSTASLQSSANTQFLRRGLCVVPARKLDARVMTYRYKSISLESEIDVVVSVRHSARSSAAKQWLLTVLAKSLQNKTANPSQPHKWAKCHGAVLSSLRFYLSTKFTLWQYVACFRTWDLHHSALLSKRRKRLKQVTHMVK